MFNFDEPRYEKVVSDALDRVENVGVRVTP